MNGSGVTYQRTLPTVYQRDDIPSISYRLQVGSSTLGFNGSLILGGYDCQRCLTDPILGSNQTFQMLSIGLGVSQGGSAYLNINGSSVSGLMSNDAQSVGQLQVMPNPEVPYMYLPASSCSVIASHLPVYFDKDLALYIWNASDPSFGKIVSSPYYISFTFATGTSDSSETSNSTIYVPFAVLNLTLMNPVVSTPTQYFPCSPYTPTDNGAYHLGRAFLQAAYLSQNWQARKLLLSQAPGPDIVDEDVKPIASSDETITPMVNAPVWNATWTTTLKLLVENSTSSASASGTSTFKSLVSRLVGGAIAGIVTGAVAGVFLIALFAVVFMRWRSCTTPILAPIGEIKHQVATDTDWHESRISTLTYRAVAVSEAPDKQIFEVPDSHCMAPQEPVEMDGNDLTGK